MKRSVFALVLLLPLTPAVHADQASKRTKINELLTVLKVDQVGKQIIDGASQQTEALGHREFGTTETPEQQKKVADLHQQVVTLITPAVEWKTLQTEFVAAYDSAYTEPEIDGILSFYKSAPGQALLAKGPEIGKKSSDIVQAHMTAIQPQLRQLVQDFARNSQPAGAAPAGSSPSLQQRPAPSLNGTPSTTPQK